MKSQRIVRLSETAQADLVGIINYIAEDNERAADKVADAITGKIAWIAASGFDGSPRDRLVPGLRVTHSGPYGIYFSVQGDAMVVHRILHGKRNIHSGSFEPMPSKKGDG